MKSGLEMKRSWFFSLAISTILLGCASVENTVPSEGSHVIGYGILERIIGQWHGPVTTTTPAGDFPDWYVDFRPVLPGQVSQYSTLDSDTINYMSFFIVKRNGELKVALRTEGVFQNQGCVTYEVIDSVDEKAGYYRFSDFKAKDERAYTEFRFKKDSFVMEVYTNKFNKVSPLELHSRWTAKLGSRSAAETTAGLLDFPSPITVKDFTDAFENMSESIYYTFEHDPYPSEPQPNVGSITVEIAVDENLPFETDHELFLLLTTNSLFDGLIYDPDNLRFISRYVYLPVGTTTYTFTHVHPGTYYLYSYNDINGDKLHKSGDYISSDISNIIDLEPEGELTVQTRIDYIIP
jgi:hypothetical protein